MTVFSMFRRRDAPQPTAKPALRSEPSLIRRQAKASGEVVLSVRMDPTSPWIEAARAWPDAPASRANLDRLQRLYATTPLVREIFLEIEAEMAAKG